MKKSRLPVRHWLPLHRDLSILDQHLLRTHYHSNLRVRGGSDV